MKLMYCRDSQHQDSAPVATKGAVGQHECRLGLGTRARPGQAPRGCRFPAFCGSFLASVRPRWANGHPEPKAEFSPTSETSFRAAKPGPHPDRSFHGPNSSRWSASCYHNQFLSQPVSALFDIFGFRILTTINTGAVSPNFGTLGHNADGGAHRFFLGCQRRNKTAAFAPVL